MSARQESATASHAPSSAKDSAAVLLDLAARCEKAKGPDRELDRAIQCCNGKRPIVKPKEYTASLDATMTLVPEGLCWRLGVNGNPRAKLLGGSAAAILGDDFGTDISTAGAATPALALCAAALRARATQSPVDEDGR